MLAASVALVDSSAALETSTLAGSATASTTKVSSSSGAASSATAATGYEELGLTTPIPPSSVADQTLSSLSMSQAIRAQQGLCMTL